MAVEEQPFHLSQCPILRDRLSIATKDNIWAINTEMDYQEEKPEE